MHMPSGKWIDIELFSPQDVDLGDIAHCLAGIIRWGGSTSRWITVEDHSLFCEELLLLAHKRECSFATLDMLDASPESEDEYCHCKCAELLKSIVPTPRIRLLVLIHDAHEAYLGDVRRPTAKILRIERYLAQIKRLIDISIWKALQIPEPTAAEHELVKFIDDWSMRLEALWYMPDSVFKIGDPLQSLTAADEPECVGVEQHYRIQPPGSTWLRKVQALLNDPNL